MTLKEIKKRKKLAEREDTFVLLRKAYEESGLTIGEISKITGVSHGTLSAWFCGARVPARSKANMVIDKLKQYFDGNNKTEYIDKFASRNLFVDRVYETFMTLPHEKCGKAIIDIYDKLPTVTRYATSKKEAETDD